MGLGINQRLPAPPPTFVMMEYPDGRRELSHGGVASPKQQTRPQQQVVEVACQKQAQFADVKSIKSSDGGCDGSSQSPQHPSAPIAGSSKDQESFLTDGRFVVLPYPPNLNIDPQGTLTLVLGNQTDGTGPRSVIVSPHIVRGLSPIWENMVARSPKSDWKTRSKRVLRLPEENPDMLIQVMRIAHSQFGNVAKTLKFQELVQMALISRRHQTNRIIIPYLDRWTDPYRADIVTPGREEWLFVAYQFGFEEDFKALSKHLALNCRVNDDGKLISANGNVLADGVFPPCSIDRIQQTRIDMLNDLLRVLYNHVNGAVLANQCIAQTTDARMKPIEDDERCQCTGTNYLSIQRAMRFLGFWPPIRSAFVILDSVNDIADRLMNLPIRTFKRSPSNCKDENQLHGVCDTGKKLADLVQAVLDDMPDPVEMSTMDQLRLNASEFETLSN